MSTSRPQDAYRHLGFAVKVVGRPGLKSNDARRWQSGPHLSVSLGYVAEIFDYLAEHDIGMYRMSSDLAPYITHPDRVELHRQVEECEAALASLGSRANAQGIRLSFHPSQYILLSSPDEGVTRRSVADLDAQARILDAMSQGPEAVVLIHVGGAYGDRAAAVERVMRAVDRLPAAARRRLAFENDERVYTVEDCLRIHQHTGVPVIFDHQHHRLNPGTLTAAEAAREALATWPREVTPKIHFSSPRLDAGAEGKRPLLSAHADYINPWEFGDFVLSLGNVRTFDVMLEAKQKDDALLKLRADLNRLYGQGD
jgi:UV DNA damage endonuclease